uniref:EF-hand domain-containing protein n=1 Tax=Mantoniella antarctica TaxID=81844 RepID=A0A7S0S8Q0_9CHLO
MSLEIIKDRVYKNRIRVKEFFADFDKLRCGSVTEAQFCSGLSMAGFNFTAAEFARLVEAFPSMNVDKTVCYKDFCDEVNGIFTKSNLEKLPLEEVDREPSNLIDSLRFSLKPSKPVAGEEAVNALLQFLSNDCKIRRISVKPFFDDACGNQNSPMRANHVTPVQFHQVLKNHVARNLGEKDVNLLIDKFKDKGMVNYVAFAARVDPKEEVYHPYLLATIKFPEEQEQEQMTA